MAAKFPTTTLARAQAWAKWIPQASLFTLQLYTGTRAATSGKRVWLCDTEATLWHQGGVSQHGKGSHCWHLHGQHMGTVLICDSSQLTTACALSRVQSPHRPLLLQQWPPPGQGSQCWERGEHRLKRSRATWIRTSRTSAPSTWDPTPPAPNKEVMVTEQRGKPCLTAGSTQPLHLQPYLLPRRQHTPGKDADSC